jgi:radical SAM family uncharacterized protein/radical SAM-linked protein
MNTTLRENVARLLPQVENPARYIGGEGNQVRKDPATCTVSWALVFPDTYELGMSNNALKVLYHLTNRVPQWRAERAFAPWPDMGKLLLENKIPLYSLESYQPLCEFDLVGITLQTELNYTNIPYVLDLAHIPMWAGERGENDPIVVGGGPCVSNPEPVAPFFDLFVIGDGEVANGQLSELLERKKKEGQTRRWFLEEAAKLRGIYVPELVEMVRSEHKEWVPAHVNGKGSYKSAKGVQRTWVEVLNTADMPDTQVVPNCDIVHDRFAVEVMRGCTQGCRFCQAGYWYRPNRELAPDAIIDLAHKGLKATGSDELGLLSLSTADYSQIAPLTDKLVDDPSFRNVNLSLPSLRANSFGQALARKIARARGNRSATFAPETGSQRLRKVINKTITDEDMISAAEGVFKNGWNSIKLYTMVGLPTETMEDMEAFCGLIKALSDIGRRHSRRAEIHASIGIMVPKPFTPMQWVPFEKREEIMERIRFVREAFRYNKSVRISWTGWETAWLEAVLARGDRSLAPVILEMYRRGTTFDSHDKNSHDLTIWRELFETHGIDAEGSTYRERTADEVFPWDFIHAGVTKGYLRAEHDKMFEAESHDEVPDCKWGACQNCGIPGSYQDIKLAPAEEGQVTLPPPGTYAGKTAKAGPAAGMSQEDEGRSSLDPLAAARIRPRERKPKLEEGAEPEVNAKVAVPPRKVQGWRLLFAKRGMARFLAHHATMELFERALRREGVSFALSQGFNPRPRIKNLGALPVGLAVENEELIVELETAPLEMDNFVTRVNSLLPEGLCVESFVLIPGGDLTRSVELRYTLRLSDLTEDQRADLPARLALLEAKELPPIEDHRGRIFDANAEIQTAKVEGEVLSLVARCNDAGNTVSAFLLFAGLLGVPQEAIRACEVVKFR